MSENKTMAIYIGSLFELDQVFSELEEEKTLELPMSPAQYESGNDVLLVSTGPKGTGGPYVVVGVLKGVKLSADEEWLKFKTVHRFSKPITGEYQNTGLRRDELMGTVDSWGPTGLYYLAPEAAKRAEELAEESLSQ